MKKLVQILTDLEQGKISSDHAEKQVLDLFAVSGSLPLTEDLINEAKEILGLSYITKIDKTPEFMKKQIQLLKFTEKVAKMIVGNDR